MQKFLEKVKITFGDRILRRRILFVIFIFAIFRLLSTIPVVGVNADKLSTLLDNQFLSVLNIFSGGGLSKLSIVMLGVGPYITASIIMQVLTIVSPNLKAMLHEEGESGRKKFAQYSRLISVPLALIQGFSLLKLLSNQGLISSPDIKTTVINLLLITAGTLITMWLGELINEFGIGNGVSMIIFAGIVASFPTQVAQLYTSYDVSMLTTYIGFIVMSIVVIAGVVFITEAERPIPVTYARQGFGDRIVNSVSTYIPLKVNQAGVIPIIFAISLLLFPQLLGQLLTNAKGFWHTISLVLLKFNQTNVWYIVVYFLLVVLFTYFYTAVTFDPESMANNLQKSGAFVSGIRPGKATEVYVSNILTRITLAGALFLGILAILPLIAQKASGITSIALGGTSIIIVVSVVIDLVRKINAELSMREY